MKKLFLLVILILSLTLALAACGGETPSGGEDGGETPTPDAHTHTPSEWITDTEPTCKVEGTKHKECTECEEVLETGKVDKLEHNYSTEFVFNATHHYYECTCGLRSNEATHISSGAPTSHNDEVCTVCGYVINEAVGIKFNTLNVNGNKVNGNVSNDTEYYTFIGEITTVGGATYIISDNISGKDPIVAQTIDLVTGDNTVYVIEFIDGEPTNIYIVTIRRRPMYDVTFNTAGGTAVECVTVEEDTILTAPQTTRAGYTFAGWDYDFTQPITQSFTATASWTAHTDTSYRVEYYLENAEKTGYDILDSETETLKGTTGTTVNAEQKTFDHFTLNTQKSTLRGNINGNGSLVLKVYYTRDTYTVSAVSNGATVTGTGTYPYGTDVTITVSGVPLGYSYNGIYSGETLVTEGANYSFKIDKSIKIKVELDPKMRPFKFTSDASTCTITEIKDKAVTEIVIPDYVTTIGDKAFYDCTSLTSVTIPDSVTSIGSSAFEDCTSLTSVTIPDSVKRIGDYAFWGCTILNAVYITDLAAWCNISFGNSYANPLNDANNLYLNGQLVRELVIPDSVTYIGKDAFYGCKSLTSVTIPDSVTTIGFGAFAWCYSLTSVTIPDSVTSIGSDAFYDCDSLTSITVDKNNTAYKDIDGNLYSKDGKTIIQYAIGKTDTNFTIPDSVTSIGDKAFRGCSSLTSVVIGKSVTSIGEKAFSSCYSLTSVVIPDSVTSIGEDAFAYCFRLTSVKYRGTKAQWNAITKGNDWNYNTGNYTITYN